MLTVFTPAYNRADMLPRLYHSLSEQTCCDFEWLIIDDGSTDNTQDVVRTFLAETRFPVRYIRKENGGKHTAHNLALEQATGEWFLCVDSDDLLTPKAVSSLIERITQLNGEIGIIAYKEDLNGQMLSDSFPKGVQLEQLHRLATVHSCCGEFTLAFQTAFAKQFPFPVFEGERFVTESVIYDRMDRHGQLALLPEVITICEYQPDGYSSNFGRLMKQNPSGFCLYFLQRIDLHTKLLQRIIHAGKYWCFRWICGRKELVYDGPYKFLVALSAIPGLAFRIYYKLFRNI
jgi:glycosyltransferase involved in cell wall biosynthesis